MDEFRKAEMVAELKVALMNSSLCLRSKQNKDKQTEKGTKELLTKVDSFQGIEGGMECD